MRRSYLARFTRALATPMTESIELLVAALALVVSATALVVARNQNRRHKLIEVTLHFQQAYDNLEMRKKDISKKEEAEYWFGRFWNLQARQYEYWLQGFIQDPIYVYWMICRRHEYLEEGLFKSLEDNDYTYKDGWSYIKDKHILKFHPYKFVEFVDSIFNLDDSPELETQAALAMLEQKRMLCGWRVHFEYAIAKYFANNIYLR